MGELADRMGEEPAVRVRRDTADLVDAAMRGAKQVKWEPLQAIMGRPRSWVAVMRIGPHRPAFSSGALRLLVSHLPPGTQEIKHLAVRLEVCAPLRMLAAVLVPMDSTGPGVTRLTDGAGAGGKQMLARLSELGFKVGHFYPANLARPGRLEFSAREGEVAR